MYELSNSEQVYGTLVLNIYFTSSLKVVFHVTQPCFGTFEIFHTIKVFNLHFYLRKTNEEVEKKRKIGFVGPNAWS